MYQFNLLMLLTNIIFVVFFTYVILPITIISYLSVHWKIWDSINLIFEKIYKLLDLISHDESFMYVTGSIPSTMVVILILIVILYVESKDFWNRYLAQYVIIFSLCVIFNKFPLFGQVTLVDIGQGDSILITTPFIRKTFLIDVGGKLSFPSKPWAKHKASNQVEFSTIPLLKSQGISKIDKVILTHKDVDHIGNLESLLDGIKVSEVNFGIGLEKNARIKADIRNYPRIKFKSIHQGDNVKTDFISWHVLWPNHAGIGENSDSVTLLAQIKNKKWLFTGDLDIGSEKKILQEQKFNVDYLKVGHHGSKTSTSDQLLEETRPKIGFISSGINNRYGHPNKETIERLEKHGVKYLNTAEYGMISWYYYSFSDKEKITTYLKGDLVENNRIKKRFKTGQAE